MPTVIGLVGEKGCGKSSFFSLLQSSMIDIEFARVSSGDILTNHVRRFGVPPTRENLQKLAVFLDKSYGQGTLTNMVYSAIMRADGDVVIFDGVRWTSDVEMLNRFKSRFLVYLTADVMIRYERTKARKEKAGEDETTFEKFCREESLPTEVDIPNIGKTADFVIKNNGSLEDLKTRVAEFCNCYLNNTVLS